MMDVTDTPVAWTPLAPQALALQCPARDVAYAGEKGAGKTEWLAMAFGPLLDLARRKYEATDQKQYRCRIAIFRKNLNHLEDLIAKTKLLYPLIDPPMGIDGFNVNRGRWTFTSGATVEFHHLDGPNDHLGFHGQEFVGLGYDQIEQHEEHAVRFINANLRSGDPDYHAARIIRATANPGGHDWIITHYGIDKCPEGGRIFAHEVENADGTKHQYTRCFIRGRLRDNPHLPPDYEAQLRATMNEDEIAMYLEGDFFRVAGSFFSKFLRPAHHFQRSRPLPSSWQLRFTLDWGSSNPAALHVHMLDNDGCLWTIDELHRPGETGRRFGEHMTRMWKGQQWCEDGRKFQPGDFWGVIDKQARDNVGGEGTAAAGIMAQGFRLFDASKDKHNGCVQMKERLLLDHRGKPRWIIFEDRCPQLVRSLSGIKSMAPKDPEIYDESSSLSHAADSGRFGCMEFPVVTAREVNPVDAEIERWNRVLNQQQRPPAHYGGMTTGYDG